MSLSKRTTGRPLVSIRAEQQTPFHSPQQGSCAALSFYVMPACLDVWLFVGSLIRIGTACCLITVCSTAAVIEVELLMSNLV